MKNFIITAILALVSITIYADPTEVYVTKSGKKYHTHANCPSLKRSTTVTKTTEEQAIKDKKELCKLCAKKSQKSEIPKNKSLGL